MLSLFPSFTRPPSCLPSLGTALLSALLQPPVPSFRQGMLPGSRARFPAASPWLALQPCGTTKALTAATVTSIAALLAYLTHTSRRSASNHVSDPDIALTAIPAYPMCFRLRLLSASSPSLPAESSSYSCRPPVRLRLLSTPLRSDAVTFGYGVLAYSDTDSHRAVCAPSRAH